MKRITQLPSLEARQFISTKRLTLFHCSYLSTTAPTPATVAPVTATGPPPKPPVTSAQRADERIVRRRKLAEQAGLLRGESSRARAGSGSSAGTTGRKRFWRDVFVRRVDDGYQIHLDTRPLRTPTKKVLTIPHHKPHLASAIALEWDLLVSAQQAMRQHLVPLTSLASRALEIADEDKASAVGEVRAAIVKMVMRFLDSDTLLCWAPESPPDPPGYEVHAGRTESLRGIQIRAAQEIIGFLTERVWPGLEIVPALDKGSIMPRAQPQMTRDVIEGWVRGLPAFELAGLERAVLAGKGLLGAVRLLVEWSAEFAHLRDEEEVAVGERFGIEEAARAASLEVDWQTRMWGEVEDTHDVNKEDLRRQLGSVILLVSGGTAK